jgi:hypothetical protein
LANATVTAGNTATQPGTTDKGNKNVAVRPFTKSSLLHDEPVAYDYSVQMTASQQRLPDIEIPASGYFRALVINVSTTSGAGTSVTLNADGPFNAIRDITLQEPNGSQIAFWTSGYQLMLSNKFGGFFGGVADPRQLYSYSTSLNTNANFSFSLRIPAEAIMRDALCALPNQNMAAKYRVKLNLDTIATVFGGTVSTAPTVRVRAVLEGWEQPLEVVDGVPQATRPPLVNSTMFHTVQDFTIGASGQAQIPLTRLGNRIRQLIFIFADNSGVRANGDANFPDPLTISLDNRPILILPRYLWLNRLSWYYGLQGAVANTVAAAGTAIPVDSGGGRENGVWPLPFNQEFLGKAGNELGDLWLKTLTTSRLELSGNFGGAGRLTVITNDVALTGEL